MRLPKTIDADPRAAGLRDVLKTPRWLLWSGGTLKIPQAQASRPLWEALRQAHRNGRVVRSLDKAEAALAAEARGQRLVDRRRGTRRGVRISRLLILAADGSERFYRRVEALLMRHPAQVAAVRLTVDAHELGGEVFGKGATARLLLIDHKEAVGTLLLLLADQWERESSQEPSVHPTV